jgi:TolB-like protein
LSQGSLFAQLKERRVIRATIIYVALLWVVLQAADLLAGAGMLTEQLVRWLILIGVAGLPVTVLASWFLESPWKERRWTAVVGDLVIIIAIIVAASLFAWQQWFTSFTRPTVAILKIEATDTREDSEDLAAHLARRFRSVLATRPELRVIELNSSLHPDLEGQLLSGKAAALGTDFLLAGTVAQNGSDVRLNVQLYSADGSVLHSETFEDSVLDQAQLQNRVFANFWPYLPLPEKGLATVRNLIASCKYPNNRDAVLAIAAVDNGDETTDLAPFIEQFDDAGMLHLAQSRLLFGHLARAPAARRPVLQPIAMQHLAAAETLCPDLPDVELLRFRHTLERRGDETLLLRHPSAAELYREAVNQNSEPRRANAFAEEARRLDPLGEW